MPNGQAKAKKEGAGMRKSPRDRCQKSGYRLPYLFTIPSFWLRGFCVDILLLPSIERLVIESDGRAIRNGARRDIIGIEDFHSTIPSAVRFKLVENLQAQSFSTIAGRQFYQLNILVEITARICPGDLEKGHRRRRLLTAGRGLIDGRLLGRRSPPFRIAHLFSMLLLLFSALFFCKSHAT